MESAVTDDLRSRLARQPRRPLAILPTPIQRLERFSDHVGGPELWMKRDDMTGLEGGGNKTRKLEFLVGDAIARGADMLVTVGAIQSNHTRQTAAVAAKAGLKCALLHCAWTKDAGPHYRSVGNILLSHIAGAQLYVDEKERPIEDQGPLAEFMDKLRNDGHTPYLIPGGASEHQLGSLGYLNCAIEIAHFMRHENLTFDYVVHCTGSSSTQSGLVAGFAALGVDTRVIGISDDDEVEIKKRRVRQLANATLELLDLPTEVAASDVEVIAAHANSYGVPGEQIISAIRQLAQTEGIVADPVYEGRAVRGLIDLIDQGEIEKDARVLLMHLGGSPALHAYSAQFGSIVLEPFRP